MNTGAPCSHERGASAAVDRRSLSSKLNARMRSSAARVDKLNGRFLAGYIPTSLTEHHDQDSQSSCRQFDSAPAHQKSLLSFESFYDHCA